MQFVINWQRRNGQSGQSRPLIDYDRAQQIVDAANKKAEDRDGIPLQIFWWVAAQMTPKQAGMELLE